MKLLKMEGKLNRETRKTFGCNLHLSNNYYPQQLDRFILNNLAQVLGKDVQLKAAGQYFELGNGLLGGLAVADKQIELATCHLNWSCLKVVGHFEMKIVRSKFDHEHKANKLLRNLCFEEKLYLVLSGNKLFYLN